MHFDDVIILAMNDNNSLNNEVNKLPLYERPGRLDPDRHVPLDDSDRVDVNVHYERLQGNYFKTSDTPEFTENSANAMNPFEDSALLKGDIKPRSTGVKTGFSPFKSKVFVPEIDTSEVRAKIKQTTKPDPESEQPVYIADDDRAAASEDIANAMSGVDVDTTTAAERKIVPEFNDISKLKSFAILLATVVAVEVTGIVLLLFL